jgi:hypothetical protein
VDVTACGRLSIITALELLQHHFFSDGSQGPPCDPNLSLPLGKHRSTTSRLASAARAATS